jgi:K+-sensing histidine kinase KdpD
MVGELRDLIHVMLSRDLHLMTESTLLSEMIESSLAAMKRPNGQPQPEIFVTLPPDLPKVQVDVDRTIRTISSLIYHARKFRSSDHLRLTAERRDAAVALKLEYRGQPLPPGEDKRSLELLYPASQGGHVLNAVGLGLGASRAVARLQGGDLSFDVLPDGQATLTLTMPLSPK